MGTSRNPLAGTPQPPEPTHPDGTSICSTFTGEQLAGTAKTATTIIALEVPRAWGKDALDGTALGVELSQQLKKHLKQHRADLQLIRRPGKTGQESTAPGHTVYIAWANHHPPLLEQLTIAEPADLLHIPLTQPGHTPGARTVTHPILLICTHGKRDRCCAIHGRPLARALYEHYQQQPQVAPEANPIWESSHTKGHRFAPSMILLPSNYSYGRLNATGAAAILDGAQHDQLVLRGNRGRGTLDAASQVAELTIARHLHRHGNTPGPASLQVTIPTETAEESAAALISTEADQVAQFANPNMAEQGVARGETARAKQLQPHKKIHKVKQRKNSARRRVHDPRSGGTYLVELEKRPSVETIASCGNKSKRVSSWVPLHIRELPTPAGQ